RLRKDIGDLIPDEVLTALVNKSINKLFFKEKADTAGYHTTYKPSFFNTLVKELFEARFRTEIDKYFTENGKKITDQIAAELVEQSPKILGIMIVNQFSNVSSDIAHDITSSILNNLRNKGMNI